MSGIVFFRSSQLEILRTFYGKELGMELWLDQGECLIFRHGNLLLGFCTSEECHNQGIITLFFRSKEEIDAWHRKLSSISMGTPQENNRFHIYHFFACDPEGRTLEFQCFLHALAPHKAGTDLLAKRRSVRRFENSSVSEELLWQVFELCRTSPTSHNTQSYYYLVVRDREKIERIISDRKLAHRELLSRNTPTYRAFLEMEKAAFADGAIEKKYKELVAVGISITLGCESCLEWHIREALESGATPDQILEAVEVGIEMGGGPATVSSRFALKALEYHAKR